MYVGIGDKVLMPTLKGEECITATDEGEAIGIAGGYWLATGERATAFMSADGFMNALNAITSWVIPEEIEMDIIISTGRMEPSHYVATEMLEPIISLLESYEGFTERVHIKLVRKES
jgi:sulfopyruvate decarboxylase TPP-binding subunit